MSLIPKKRRILSRAARQSFPFQKITGSLKINVIFLLPILGKQSKFSAALRQVNKQHFKEYFWIWVGALKQLGTTWRVANFFLRKSLHPIVSTHVMDIHIIHCR